LNFWLWLLLLHLFQGMTTFGQLVLTSPSGFFTCFQKILKEVVRNCGQSVNARAAHDND
jgi:hypothetical protein